MYRLPLVELTDNKGTVRNSTSMGFVKFVGRVKGVFIVGFIIWLLVVGHAPRLGRIYSFLHNYWAL